MVDPKILCRQHLLGEHKELHMMVGHFKKKYKIDGYIRNNCIEPLSIISRHIELLNEMIARGYNHKSELILNINDISYLGKEIIEYKVNKDNSLLDLIGRCKECKDRFDRTI